MQCRKDVGTHRIAERSEDQGGYRRERPKDLEDWVVGSIAEARAREPPGLHAAVCCHVSGLLVIEGCGWLCISLAQWVKSLPAVQEM